MRIHLIVVVFLGILLARVQAQSAMEPPDRFVTAYAAYQRGENLESLRDFSGAIQAYKDAAEILDAIGRASPEWNPAIVEFRRKRIREAIAKLQPKTATSGQAASAVASNPGATDLELADRFLIVFKACQNGERLAATGDVAGALQSYKEAAQILDEIASASPAWNHAIVEYRRKRISEAMTKIRPASD